MLMIRRRLSDLQVAESQACQRRPTGCGASQPRREFAVCHAVLPHALAGLRRFPSRRSALVSLSTEMATTSNARFNALRCASSVDRSLLASLRPLSA